MGHHHHDHACGHDHHGHHHHTPKNFDEAFAVGVLLNISFVCIGAFYGFMSHSMALLADAGHNLSDVLSLIIAWAASWLSRKPPSKQRTYGFGRSSILASLFNALTLMIAVGGIAWGAAARLFHPVPVATHTVMWVAFLGIVINTGTALMFMRGRKEDMNIQSAFLHMAYDAAISLGVVVAAFIMQRTGWLWLDPAISLLIVALIASSTYTLLRQSVDLTLDAVPPDIDLGAVEKFLAALPGVTAVHDLHIWPISTTSNALTAHLVRPGGHGGDAWLFKVGLELHEKFRIDHPTIQVELGDSPYSCKLASAEVV
jgi:cobalt-zinc-cadmium efflux system protein